NGTTFPTAHVVGGSRLEFAPGQTLTRTILLEGPGASIRSNGTPGSFTVGPTGAIRTATAGTPNIGAGMDLTNQGLISAEVSGFYLVVNPSTLLNNGTMQALNGAGLDIQALAPWSNAGTISAPSSNLRLTNFDATG